MIDRGLLFKEWKHNQALFITIFCLLLLITPASIIDQYHDYQHTFYHFSDRARFVIDYTPTDSFTWRIGIAIILAVVQLGVERSKGWLDFTLSLPYTRGQVFNTKFLLGGVVLMTSQLLSYLLSEVLFIILKPESVLFFQHYMIGSLVISFMAYALVIAAGAMTGHIFAQLLTAFSVTIMPFLLVVLPFLNVKMIFERDTFWHQIPLLDNPLLQFCIPIVYINTGAWLSESMNILLIPAIMSILFYLIGYFCFSKQPSERAGSFFLWKQLDRPVQIAVIIFGILGFGYIGYDADDSLIGYGVGMIIGAVVGFLLSYFLIYKKTKY
ncbi:ABC-2 transporter permease [Bacillus changyiensis]|uniref:ABC transporter permease subunit n=1 Tax=Bacillus changyiensis TaxID=3004103 RepID=UPI0022E57F14|nr:ABC transporter permease subunit [Bacillus changyiensis]MDA1477693.1 ABC transporter permease subunit [Bacillus changyiensis]